METKQKRFNWRVSEGVAAELIQARRITGCRSWDEYFFSVLHQPHASASQKNPSSDEREAHRQEHQELRSELAAIRHLLETQEQARQADEHEHAETREMLRRFYELLSLALTPDKPESDTPHPTDRGHDVLDSIRTRRYV